MTIPQSLSLRLATAPFAGGSLHRLSFVAPSLCWKSITDYAPPPILHHPLCIFLKILYNKIQTNQFPERIAKMSKYTPLWEYIIQNGAPSLKLTFDEIQQIIGFPLDHSFLRFKKELLEYGYQVEKISMKNQTVLFSKAI